MRIAVVLPAAYAAVVIPLALFVVSGAGTHLSPLLLYLPSAPWWLIYPGGSTMSEIAVFRFACEIGNREAKTQ